MCDATQQLKLPTTMNRRYYRRRPTARQPSSRSTVMQCTVVQIKVATIVGLAASSYLAVKVHAGCWKLASSTSASCQKQYSEKSTAAQPPILNCGYCSLAPVLATDRISLLLWLEWWQGLAEWTFRIDGGGSVYIMLNTCEANRRNRTVHCSTVRQVNKNG